MAVGLDGTDYLRRTAELPTSVAFTICGWAHLVTDTNAFCCLCSLEVADINSSGLYLLAGSNGTSLEVFNGTSGASFASMTVGQPFFFALTNQGTGGTDAKGYFRAATSATLSTGSHGGTSFTPGVLYIGSDSYFASDTFNGRMWNVKIWNRALSADELLAESFYNGVKFPTSLNGHWLLRSSGDLIDYSGNGRTLTVNGTIVDAEPSWQPWKPSPRVYGPVTAAPSTPIGALIGGKLLRGGLLAGRLRS
jgi:hypothetical protein